MMMRGYFSLLAAGTGLLLTYSQPAAADFLPGDADATCTVPSTDFNGWFASGSPSENGAVLPPESVTFPTDNTVCDFYLWAARSFYWLTSPEGNSWTFNSDAFFNVSAEDKKGNRTMRKSAGGRMFFALRATKDEDVSEVGQAGSGGVLLSQAGSLVYYGIHVNDLYGYFLTGQKGGDIDATVFPNTPQDMKSVMSFASTFDGTDLPNPQALSIEVKTSWVDASTLPDSSKYVTLDATVPKYKANKDNTKWSYSGSMNVTLALVGMHIVGTVQNHPEFVWVTFEHMNNAPNDAFYYINSSKASVKAPYDSSGTWVFMETDGTTTGANTQCMKTSGQDIVADKCATVQASNTFQSFPWGSAADDSSTATTTNNTLIISLNNSVIGQLVGNDVRKNYALIGGIWTNNGIIPEETGYSDSNLRGSLKLVNTTMETYVPGTHCFSCHQQQATSPNSFQDDELTHIYYQIKPLKK